MIKRWVRLRWALLAVAFVLWASYQLKSPCLVQSWAGPEYLQYRTFCYNDIQPLYTHRHFDKKLFPYIQHTALEYPVVIGLQMWLASLLVGDAGDFFRVNAAFLSLAALISLFALWFTLKDARVFWFALGTPLFLYAFHNWDLLPVMSLCLGAWAWTRGSPLWLGAALGFGASSKLFPGFCLIPLFVFLIHGKGFADIRLLGLGFLGTVLAIQAPVLLGDWLYDGRFDGWLGALTFQSDRTPDFGSIWYGLSSVERESFSSVGLVLSIGGAYLASRFFGGIRRRSAFDFFAFGVVWIFLVTYGLKISSLGSTAEAYRSYVDTTSFFLLLSGVVFLVGRQWKAGTGPWAISAALVALVLVFSKIHSPQFALWLLPFFAFLSFSWKLKVAYFLVDFLVLFGQWTWMSHSPEMAAHWAQTLFLWAVFIRAGLLLGIAHECLYQKAELNEPSYAALSAEPSASLES